ncbi:short chain alcohol dehydrogenase [Aureobasidium pullulans]|uniref:Short chain alcohol dehydrogenase n=1 Tax=Aureobasidium pullulans TaxID=5580 RepID=A0A4T0C232_AURPU|nr:short chain alcohol dehydrogenase [Aureobasidium pullulans]
MPDNTNQSVAKTAIVSGGARGIGRCIVRRFLERGYKVFIFDIDEEELKHTTTVHLKQYYEKKQLSSAICDLRSVDEIREKVKEAAEFLGGRIEVVVNNGGIATPTWSEGKTMADFDTFSQWQAYMETNLTAPFAVSQACLPYMKLEDKNDSHHADNSHAGPCVIHVGSFRAEMSDPNQEGYASSKSGLIGLMHSMAISLGPWGIRCNLVAPGRIKVAHECKEGDEKGLEWAHQNEDKDVDDHATNRAGRPKDIADAVEYLVNAGFVTGQAITVDGGAVRMK